MLALKRIILLQLLLLLLCNQLGYYFFYAYNQYRIKEDIKHQLVLNLPENKLTIFASNDERIVWAEDQKEFSINGKMYDIAKVKVINNNKYYYCLSDDEETTLLKNYAQKCKSETENNKSKKDKSNIFFQLIFLNAAEISNHFSYKPAQKKVYPYFNQKPTKQELATVYPPPKLL